MDPSTTIAPAGRAAEAATVTEALRRTVAEHPDLVASGPATTRSR